VVDSGAHRAFFAHYFTSYEPRTYYTAAGLGPMGWAVAAAVGVKAALPDRPVACVAGDDGLLAHGMEVATAARYGMNILYVVINTGAYGDLRPQVGEAGARSALPTQDFAAFGRSMGARGVVVSTPGELLPALAEGLAGEGPCVVDVRCDSEAIAPPALLMEAELRAKMGPEKGVSGKNRKERAGG
jgi:acetolactate synthase I/II/III large subunit